MAGLASHTAAWRWSRLAVWAESTEDIVNRHWLQHPVGVQFQGTAPQRRLEDVVHMLEVGAACVNRIGYGVVDRRASVTYALETAAADRPMSDEILPGY